MIFNDEYLTNYALTGHTSRYSEDGLTAKHLLIKTSSKVVDCLNVIQNIYDSLESEKEYNNEELVISFKLNISTAKQYINKFNSLFNENSVSNIELAGNIAKAINEGLIGIEKLIVDHSLTNTFADLLTLVEKTYILQYNDCAMTLLELAGVTACAVNELIAIINTIESKLTGVEGGYTDEELTILLNERDNETLEI